jgi:hypothetical protein
MPNVYALRIEFNKAKQALLSKLFNRDEPASEEDIQAALDHMSRVFNELLLSTLEDIGQLPEHQQVRHTQEFLCAYAINAGDSWSGSKWEVAFVNGAPVNASDSPLLVREFTKQMVANGWKVVTSPTGTGPTDIRTPDGKLIYELYFCRSQPGESRVPRLSEQPPENSSSPIDPSPN